MTIAAADAAFTRIFPDRLAANHGDSRAGFAAFDEARRPVTESEVEAAYRQTLGSMAHRDESCDHLAVRNALEAFLAGRVGDKNVS